MSGVGPSERDVALAHQVKRAAPVRVSRHGEGNGGGRVHFVASLAKRSSTKTSTKLETVRRSLFAACFIRLCVRSSIWIEVLTFFGTFSAMQVISTESYRHVNTESQKR